MKILLVRPPVPSHTIGLKNVMICEPLELEYVAAGLQGHDVQIFDGILERGLKRRLRKFKPDVVGTSCYITGVNEAKRFVARRNCGIQNVAQSSVAFMHLAARKTLLTPPSTALCLEMAPL